MAEAIIRDFVRPYFLVAARTGDSCPPKRPIGVRMASAMERVRYG